MSDVNAAHWPAGGYIYRYASVREKDMKPRITKASRGSDWAAPVRRRIRARLLAWYDNNKRDLPWRRRQGDGYAQLLAEFMLQQTQVSTVVGYYERFLGRFPSVAALAAADRDDVLALWSGLGYYSRARSLHSAAQQIVQRHGGRVPEEVETLMALPGIGRYTAGAIASIAYNERAPVLDGNVARVLMRLLGMADDPKLPAVKARLWSMAEALLPRRRCGDFNQALMELGATVCTPRAPRCPLCPLRSDCKASIEGRTAEIPAVARRTPVISAKMVTAAVRKDSTLLFVRRPTSGLWGGLWELPSEPVRENEKLDAARRRLQHRLPAGCRLDRKPLPPVTRRLTHRRITFHTYEGSVSQEKAGTSQVDSLRWISPDALSKLGISRASEAILRLIGWLRQ